MFKQLGGLRALTTAPFMALTASAPPILEQEVKESSELANCVIVTLPLDRPTIYSLSEDFCSLKYEIFQKKVLFES